MEPGRQSRTPRQGSAFGHHWGLLHQPLSCQRHKPHVSGNQPVLAVQQVEDEGPVQSPSPGELQALSPVSPLSPEPPGAPVPQPLQPGCLLSPPDSEAY